MLLLKNITKTYDVANEKVEALKGINLRFRKNEFVSILGPSGCGKTTLLNIIGGLDHYTSGNLIIQGKSTKKFEDGDWDTYRNHSIGFIFQSYHLIPHQTILQNVELALMMSGVPKAERRRRAVKALAKVGLKGKLNSKPNQLSGGQAQRVAIARALINDPEIVLADEPTGALDSKTSVQIMKLLKEIAKDRLVIMVTHNPELAEQYSTRIINLLDGEIVGDSNPYRGIRKPVGATSTQSASGTQKNTVKQKGKKKNSSMPALMAMGLSLKNLLSKGKRTAMVSVAGSIGIVGVSLVLAISAGVQGYIVDMENDMLSGYPVSVTQSTYNFSSLMALNSGNKKHDIDLEALKNGDKVYVESLLKTLGTFSTGFEKTNNITDAYLAYVNDMPKEYINLIQYSYAFKLSNNIYTDFVVSNDLDSHIEGGNSSGYTNTYNMSVTAIRNMYASVLSEVPEYSTWASTISTVKTFSELPSNYDYVMSQYDVLAIDKDGEPIKENFDEEQLKEIFSAKDTLVMVVDDYSIDDLTLAQYGYFTEDEFLDYAQKGIDEEKYADVELVGEKGIPYSKFVGRDAKKFAYYPNDCIYTKLSYIPKPMMSDSDIDSYFGIFAPQIKTIRKTQGDEGLKQVYAGLVQFSPELAQMSEDRFIKMLHYPTEEDRVESFIANAYSTEYDYDGNTVDTSDDIVLPAFADRDAVQNKVDLGVKIILQKKSEVSYGCLNTGFYYTKALTDYVLQLEQDSEISKYIKENGNLKDVPMSLEYYYVDESTEQGYYKIKTAYNASIDTGGNMMSTMIGSITGSSKGISAAMIAGDDTPTGIYFYPIDFEYKNKITDYLDAWNTACEKGTNITLSNGVVIDGLAEGNKITYTDTVGLIINMVNTMIQMITIALICFTGLSLVVSTVMIGIITYVSVVERVKEIGILRAVGARKKDIKRLFNAETFIIGLVSGVFGIAVTYIVSGIINLIVGNLSGVYTIAALPIWQAIVMICISIGLTLISGLIPASAAAKKDPVVALRTE